MPAELIKEGAKIEDSLLVHNQNIHCSHCGQAYKLHYSPDEAHHLETLIHRAKAAVNHSHSLHPDSLSAPWYS